MAIPSSSSSASGRPSARDERHHQRLSEYYRATLTSLLSCTPANSASAFDAFVTMANASSSSSSGQGLHLATLAWAGRHMANQGQEQYETVSEGLASQANGIITARMGEWSTMGGEWWSETECLTLLGGLLMLMQVKVGLDVVDGWLTSDLPWRCLGL